MKNINSLTATWVIFAIMFTALAIFHWRAAGSSMPEFKIPERPEIPGVKITGTFAGVPLDKPLQDFAKDMNAYVLTQNESSTQSNMLSFWGYVLASLTALLSAAIEARPRENNKRDTGDHENRDEDSGSNSIITGKNQSAPHPDSPEAAPENERPNPQGNPIDTVIVH
jgi:hypothetical protein